MFYVLRSSFTSDVLRLRFAFRVFSVSCSLVLHFVLCVLRFTFYVLRFEFYVLRFTFLRGFDRTDLIGFERNGEHRRGIERI